MHRQVASNPDSARLQVTRSRRRVAVVAGVSALMLALLPAASAYAVDQTLPANNCPQGLYGYIYSSTTQTAKHFHQSAGGVNYVYTWSGDASVKAHYSTKSYRNTSVETVTSYGSILSAAKPCDLPGNSY